MSLMPSIDRSKLIFQLISFFFQVILNLEIYIYIVILELESKIETNHFKLNDSNKLLNYTLSWDVNESFHVYFDYIQYYPASKDYEKVK